ncbi:hypothetical protein F5Y03DRAFT_321598 [Xylaria venustula]|nr:hypothetical protein F5Y03DRAFT_321598 [Xylaria venustula]
MDRLKSIPSLFGWNGWPSQQKVATSESELVAAQDTNPGIDLTSPPIEDYPSGYPQYSSLISSYDPFFAFRSFRRLRARLLLSKQDELSVLEAQLDRLDREEVSPFFLGTCRDDRNAERTTVLAQIYSKLADYDVFVGRCRHMLSYNSASSRDVTSLLNWLEGTGCLSEEETSYLDRRSDLVSLASSSDLALEQLEDWVEDRLIQHYQGFRESPGFGISSNSTVYIYSGKMIKGIATGLMLLLITFLLLMPVVICILIDSIVARVLIIIISTAGLLVVLSRLTKSKMMELILAGATFATVLIVFVSNSGSA